MIKRILGRASGWMIAALLGITIYAGMQARGYALRLSDTQGQLVRAEEQATILREHQRWQREQIDRLGAVLAFRDEQVVRDNQLVDMMRNTAAQMERDDANTSDWAGQPLPVAVDQWVRKLSSSSDGAGARNAGSAAASVDAPE